MRDHRGYAIPEKIRGRQLLKLRSSQQATVLSQERTTRSELEMTDASIGNSAQLRDSSLRNSLCAHVLEHQIKSLYRQRIDVGIALCHRQASREHGNGSRTGSKPANGLDKPPQELGPTHVDCVEGTRAAHSKTHSQARDDSQS